jgi:hypothetical protein
MVKDGCQWWPRCSCCECLFTWGFVLRNGEHLIWDLDELQAVEDLIFVSLCCVQKRCPDDEVRANAKQQLRKSYWDAQKSRSMMEQ